MALHASYVNGNTIVPGVYNDFLNLLTGVMTDQPVTLKYQPSSGTTAALTLYSKASHPLIKGFKPDGTTQAFVIDENGNLTVTSISTGGGTLTIASISGSAGSLPVSSLQSGAASGVYFSSWDGAATHTPFSVGGQFNSALAWADNSGNFVGASFQTGGTGGSPVTLDWDSAGTGHAFLQSALAGASVHGIYFKTWTGSASVVPLSIGGQIGGALAYVDIGGSIHSSGAILNSDDSTNQVNTIGPQNPAGSSRSINFQSWDGSAGHNVLSIGTSGFHAAAYFDDGGTLHSPALAIQSKTTFIGFKDSSGNKIAEMKLNQLVVGGSSSTAFSTSGASSGFGNSAAFDSFDVAEAYETDGEYERGAVLCPGPDGKLTRCTHDGCRAALIVSTGGAVNIGGRFSDDADYDSRIKPMALVGRVLVDTDEAIPAFIDNQPTLVAANGRGGVRAMRPGEVGFAIGYALTAARDGKLGVFVSRMFCQA